MSFTEIFAPGLRHWREQRELQLVLVNTTPQPDIPLGAARTVWLPTSSAVLTPLTKFTLPL